MRTSLHSRRLRALLASVAGSALIASAAAAVAVAEPSASASAPQAPPPRPVWSAAATHDVSPSLRALAARDRGVLPSTARITEERGAPNAHAPSSRTTGDAAVQSEVAPASIPGTIANFEGLSNQDNFNTFGFRVNPPDPVGDVGPNH